MNRCTQYFYTLVMLATMISSVNLDVISASSQTTLTLDLQNAELSEVFRKIAKVSGLNLVVSPQVQGTITTRLVEIPWEQALTVILKTHRLNQERHGNVILISPRRDVVQRRQQVWQRRQLDIDAEAVVTRVVTINYADAAALKTHLDNMLGQCASIGVDTRTNSLIITGTPSCLQVHYVPQR